MVYALKRIYTPDPATSAGRQLSSAGDRPTSTATCAG